MKNVAPIVLALFILPTLGCGPGDAPFDPATRQTYLVYDYNPDSEDYVLIESRIESIEDPVTLSGEIAFLRGGGNIVQTRLQPETREDWENAISVQGHNEPSARYHLEGDVIVPFDFDTQMMVTLYHHLERATDYFDSIGFDTSRIGQMPVYYYPQTTLFGFNLPLLTDNAAYAYTLDAFLIPPTLLLDEEVPLSANRGVIVHEYSHAVVNRIVHDDKRVPDFVFEGYGERTTNQIRSLDEGLADTFAALATGDPDFIGPSISSELFDIDRDLTIERVWDDELQDEAENSDTLAGRNPYILGSVLASTMWATRDFLTDPELTSALLAAMEEVDPGADFELAEFFDAFFEQMALEDRDDVCQLYDERLPYIADDLRCATLGAE